MTTIGDRIGIVLKNSSMTQSELAKKSGLSPSHISRFINNTREPSCKSLIKLCKALTVNSDLLLGLTEYSISEYGLLKSQVKRALGSLPNGIIHEVLNEL